MINIIKQELEIGETLKRRLETNDYNVETKIL